MDSVKKAIKRLANESDSDDEDDVPLAQRMVSHINNIMQGDYGTRIRETITPLAKKVEGKIRDVVAQVAPKTTLASVPGALVIK